MFKNRFLFILMLITALTQVNAQEDSPFVTYDVPSQNLLKYNRFLINPTFSTVREDVSYINLLHRNQSVQFDDNNQNYFLSYSGRISDRTGLGLSLYSQREGTVSNFGVLANYAYGVKLSDKSNFTFGANVSYYNSGFDQNRVTTVEEDPFLAGLQDSNLLSFQPGFNISYGKFDFGLFAENLFDYNLKTSESVTEFKDKTFSGHLQYTHEFENASGILESGRLMPLARARKVGEDDVVLGGSLILDLPKIGWVQGGYDSFYGASAGVGFNLSKRLSLGYTMEKGLSSNFDNFGVTHEISFAYSFTPNLTEDRVLLEKDNDLVDADEPIREDAMASSDDLEDLKRKLAENDAIIEELMFRQDSLEANRKADLQKRFEMVMRMVRNETNGTRPDLEEKAKTMFLGGKPPVALADNNTSNDGRTPSGNQEYTNQSTNGPKANENPVFETTTPSDRVKDAVATTKSTYTTKPETARDRVQHDSPTHNEVQHTIKSRKFRDLEGVEDGYYVVANVYKGGVYMNRFIENLEQKGLSADYIDNPNNGLKYVYLERYDTWQEAVAAHNSNIDGKYDGATWIMNVDNRYTNEAYAENSNKIKERSSKYNTDILQKNVIVKDKVAANNLELKTQIIQGIDSGYYLIANVFANPNNAKRFVKLLNSYGLHASYFINPENNYRYVYLKKHQSWNNALISYYTKLNDSYDDQMWIMRVTPNQIA
ncbi:type IX secretion system membrane protein PorP/SprF [Maribacter polysiphoniae]|uniref:Type IX secretion system PorP/SprF family membrane protein n=1 Tax=Maribacter polysiphoniae TaxID=429344 RepID=A0A316E535_9FLAO|nr:type IX secretion system membrane protein PorP/SprF [Maribacter polysiphoniae]MBD1260042.1 type IX secretion system membrane protein PorP/SprF [Maribacter polysiphoniae]PWK25501.1 type IX secretion system PorP/SprF family membrane protein [Maribacter polysiphoniae]